MDCSLPDSSVHRISQARILERVAISFSRGSSIELTPGIEARSPLLQVVSLLTGLQGAGRLICLLQVVLLMFVFRKFLIKLEK